MILRGVQTVQGDSVDLFFGPQEAGMNDLELEFEQAMAFPGLVNSHDHLDFNLFPQMGHGPYADYREWGRHIHRKFAAEIAGVLRIPVELRAQWGLYKNLLCGVTTVVNHGAPIHFKAPVIRVCQPGQSLHSIGFERGWRWKLNNPLRRHQACVLHVGEGNSKAAAREAATLLRWNLLQRDLVGVHAIAVEPLLAKRFKALVWCPVSNYFLFDRTAPVNEFSTRLLFGSDSTLTGSWNFWDHLRLARQCGLVSDEELLRMLTQTAAEVWSLPGYESAGRWPGDVVIAKKKNEGDLWTNFFALQPSDILLVVQGGRIRLFDDSLFLQLKESGCNIEQFSPIGIRSSTKWVFGNLPALMSSIQSYAPHTSFPVHSTPSLHDL